MSFTEHAEPLEDRHQTAKAIKALVSDFQKDLDEILLEDSQGNQRPLSSLTLREFFDFVKKIPYRKDIKPIEIIGRPLWIMEQVSAKVVPGIDCKKKSVLMGAFFERTGRQYRFIGSSCRPDKQIHHIFPQVYLRGVWVNADATYPRNVFGERKQVTASEVL